jgi:hypothetical protein
MWPVSRIRWVCCFTPFQCVQAQVLDELGQTEKALEVLSKEEAVISDVPTIHYVRALILQRNDRIEEAKNALKLALTNVSNYKNICLGFQEVLHFKFLTDFILVNLSFGSNP